MLRFLFITFTDFETTKFYDLLFYLPQVRLSFSGLVLTGSDSKPPFSFCSVECQCCSKEDAAWLRMAKRETTSIPTSVWLREWSNALRYHLTLQISLTTRGGECLQLSPPAQSWLYSCSTFTLSRISQSHKWRMRHFHWLTTASPPNTILWRISFPYQQCFTARSV